MRACTAGHGQADGPFREAETAICQGVQDFIGGRRNFHGRCIKAPATGVKDRRRGAIASPVVLVID